ncbi:MAG: arylsulfatase, partial [Planctomycetota bacterium]
PPIHLLFAADRGLRKGNWKLVSFQSAAWELYNLKEDRAELHDLAKQDPERLNEMVKMWHDMTENVLHASTRSGAPVNDDSRLPHRHREWTNFAAETPMEYVRRKRKPNIGGTATLDRSKRIRARKNTQMRMVENEIQLTFTGDDPGIAIDLRGRPLAEGPYELTFRLKSSAKGNGEFFYTTDPKTTLPKGKRISFPVHSGDLWQVVRIDIPDSKRIHQFRIDVSDGPGSALMSDLELQNEAGTTSMNWPNTP